MPLGRTRMAPINRSRFVRPTSDSGKSLATSTQAATQFGQAPAVSRMPSHADRALRQLPSRRPWHEVFGDVVSLYTADSLGTTPL